MTASTSSLPSRCDSHAACTGCRIQVWTSGINMEISLYFMLNVSADHFKATIERCIYGGKFFQIVASKSLKIVFGNYHTVRFIAKSSVSVRQSRVWIRHGQSKRPSEFRNYFSILTQKSLKTQIKLFYPV